MNSRTLLASVLWLILMTVPATAAALPEATPELVFGDHEHVLHIQSAEGYVWVETEARDAVGLWRQSNLWRIDPGAQGKAEKVTSLGSDYHVAGGKVFYLVGHLSHETNRYEIRFLDLKTGRVSKVDELDLGSLYSFEPSSTGDWLAFGGAKGGKLICLRDGRSVILHQPPVWLDITAKTPKVAVVDGNVLRIATLEGTQPLYAAPAGSMIAHGMRWSPDGSQMTLVTNQKATPKYSLVLIDQNGQSRTLLQSDDWLSAGEWAPDGRKLAVETQDADFNTTFTILEVPSGTPLKQLRFPGFETAWFCWAPDSATYAYFRPADGAATEVRVGSLTSQAVHSPLPGQGFLTRGWVWSTNPNKAFLHAHDRLYVVTIAREKGVPPGPEVQLSASARKALNVFFSNFAEVSLQPFGEDQIDDPALIDFAIHHHWINNPRLFEPVDAYHGRLAAKHVESTVRKYFNRPVVHHQATQAYGTYRNGYYVISYASGDAYSFTQVRRLFDLGNNYCLAYLDVYTASSGFTGDPHGTPEDWRKAGQGPVTCEKMRATIRRVVEDGTSRYVLVDYLPDNAE